MVHLEKQTRRTTDGATRNSLPPSAPRSSAKKAPKTEIEIQHDWLVSIEPEAFYANVPCTD